MKKIVLVIIMIVLLLMNGCGAKQKMEEKLTEKIIESAVGSNADIDIDGDEVTIKSESGDFTFGSTEWPKTQLTSKIPEFKSGDIVSVMNSEAYAMVIIEKVEASDFMDYYEKVKGEFTQESYESKTEDFISYMGTNEDNIVITISYGSEDKTLSITGSLEE